VYTAKDVSFPLVNSLNFDESYTRLRENVDVGLITGELSTEFQVQPCVRTQQPGTNDFAVAATFNKWKTKMRSTGRFISHRIQQLPHKRTYQCELGSTINELTYNTISSLSVCSLMKSIKIKQRVVQDIKVG
jgi:hypothetical protein